MPVFTDCGCSGPGDRWPGGIAGAVDAYAGRPVSLPWRLKDIAPLFGDVHHIKVQKHTAPQFAVFVVLRDAPLTP